MPFPNMRFLAEFPFLWDLQFQQPDNQIERHSVSRISSFLPSQLQPVVKVHLISREQELSPRVGVNPPWPWEAVWPVGAGGLQRGAHEWSSCP